MDMVMLSALIHCIGEQAAAMDNFVETQRAVGVEIRSRNWAGLEGAIEKAMISAATVSEADKRRAALWASFTSKYKLPDDVSIFRAALSIPVKERPLFNAAYRNLRLAAMRARIEHEALSGFVDISSSTLKGAMETAFPERKGRIYSKNGHTRRAADAGLVLNTAL